MAKKRTAELHVFDTSDVDEVIVPDTADIEMCIRAIEMLTHAKDNIEAITAAAKDALGSANLNLEGILSKDECEHRLSLWRQRLERLETN